MTGDFLAAHLDMLSRRLRVASMGSDLLTDEARVRLNAVLSDAAGELGEYLNDAQRQRLEDEIANLTNHREH